MEQALGTADGVRRPMRAKASAEAPDSDLVARIRAGDEAAFEALYERYARGVLSYSRHMLDSLEDAEEATQHAFIASYREIAGGDREIEVRPWLYAVARNRCLSILRSRREEASEEIEVATDGLSREVERRAELRDLVADLHALPDRQRSALLLTELGDLSQSEIAGILECKVGQVKGLVFRARSALMERRSARETDCAEVREELASATGGTFRKGRLKHHLEACAGCSEYLAEVRRQRSRLATALPVVPAPALFDGIASSLGLATKAAAAGGGASAAAGSGSLAGGASSGGSLGAGAASAVSGAAGAGTGAATGPGAAATGAGMAANVSAAAGGGASAAAGAGAGAAAGAGGAGGGLAAVGAAASGLVTSTAAKVAAVVVIGGAAAGTTNELASDPPAPPAPMEASGASALTGPPAGEAGAGVGATPGGSGPAAAAAGPPGATERQREVSRARARSRRPSRSGDPSPATAARGGDRSRGGTARPEAGAERGGPAERGATAETAETAERGAPASGGGQARSEADRSSGGDRAAGERPDPAGAGAGQPRPEPSQSSSGSSREGSMQAQPAPQSPDGGQAGGAGAEPGAGGGGQTEGSPPSKGQPADDATAEPGPH